MKPVNAYIMQRTHIKYVSVRTTFAQTVVHVYASEHVRYLTEKIYCFVFYLLLLIFALTFSFSGINAALNVNFYQPVSHNHSCHPV